MEVYGKQVFPSQMPVDSGAYVEGEVLKASSTAPRACKTTAKGDTAIAIVAEAVTTARDGSVRTVPAGYRIPVYLLGCHEVVYVKMVVSVALNPGSAIYLDDTTDGACNATGATSRPIGHYPYAGFPAITATVAGQLVPCLLDVEVGAATV